MEPKTEKKRERERLIRRIERILDRIEKEIDRKTILAKLEDYLDDSLSYSENYRIAIDKLKEWGLITDFDLMSEKERKEFIRRQEALVIRSYEEEVRRYMLEIRKKIEKENIPQIERFFEPIFEKIDVLLNDNNGTRGLVIIGETGIGKTFNVQRYLQKRGISYTLIKGHITPLALYSQLVENPDGLFVFDDVLRIFENKENVAILLGALDDGIVKWLSPQKLIALPNITFFSGKMIFILNKSEEKNEFVEALFDRCYVYRFDIPYKKRIEMLYTYAKMKGIPFEIVDFLRERFLMPTLRDLNRAFAVWKTKPSDWKRIVLEFHDELNEDLRLVYELEKKPISVKEKIEKFFEETGKSRRTYFRYKQKLKALGLI